eukprot:8963835-Prorocentrum_lima.AAC.1
MDPRVPQLHRRVRTCGRQKPWRWVQFSIRGQRRREGSLWVPVATDYTLGMTPTHDRGLQLRSVPHLEQS